MYNELAKYTNLLYSNKNYEIEVEFIKNIIRKNNPKAKTILEVACGAGNHSRFLQKAGFRTVGVDLNEGMIKIAKRNLPKTEFYVQDMKELNLPMKFDVILCLFNSINYAFGYEELRNILKGFSKHLNNRGIIILDSFFLKENWKHERFDSKAFSFPNLDVARVNKITIKRDFVIVDQTYIVYENGKKKVINNINKMYLFERNKLLGVINSAGFNTKLYYDFFDRKRKGWDNIYVARKK